MLSITILSLAFAISVRAQHPPASFEYLAQVCQPEDVNAPCYAAYLIQAECSEGSADVLDQLNNTATYHGNDPVLPPRDQQVCLCESQFFDQVAGCAACFEAHGGSALPQDMQPYPTSLMSSFSSSYCAATNTPSAGFMQAFESLRKSASLSSGSATASFTDPIGNKTAVSLYYTPAVTGSVAVYFDQVVPSSGASASTSISVNTNSQGQIVETASITKTTSATAAGGSAVTTTSGKGAAPSAGVEKMAVAGVIGLAAVAVML